MRNFLLTRPARFAALLLACLTMACTRAPVTDRLQYNLIPESVMLPLGKSAYADMLSGQKLEKSGDDFEKLKAVGKRISKVAQRPDFKWRYALIEDKDTINAWCLPGGKIAFYTGILPVLQNEAGMAFVMGHEVGHATARHGAERLSQQLTVLGGLAGLSIYLDRRTEMKEEQRNLLLAALGVGAQVGVLLPFSRKQEKEADVIGMMYMAGAGYPPSEALKVWNRMEEAAGGASLPAFLSTHPSNDQRKGNLKDWVARAEKRYQRNRLSQDTTTALWR